MVISLGIITNAMQAKRVLLPTFWGIIPCSFYAVTCFKCPVCGTLLWLQLQLKLYTPFFHFFLCGQNSKMLLDTDKGEQKLKVAQRTCDFK